MRDALNEAGSPSENVPLFVDLDGTLLRTDSLHEGILVSFRRSPLRTLAAAAALFGRNAAAGKRQIAELCELDVTRLPYNDEVVAYAQTARASGRKVYLATAADRSIALAVAAHLGVFDGVLASDGATNLKGTAKLSAIRRLAAGEFEYVGDSRADTPIWKQSSRASAVAGSRGARTGAYHIVGAPRGAALASVRILRPHQWAKNLLIFLPLLAGHTTDPLLFLRAALMFVAFCACASAMYIVNDLLDVQHDRRHPRKRRRPFASGDVALATGVAIVPLLLLGALACAIPLGWWSVGVLALYVALTTSYSLWLKRFELLDTLVLAGLYTIRIVAGFTATGVLLSFWLLAFSLFVFVSLAFLKRFSELRSTVEEMRGGRGYLTADADIVAIMGICSGFIAVLVLALYINSDAVTRLYAHPIVLWGIVPVALYWIAGCWFDAARGVMNDDPVIYALTHRRSLVTLGCGFAVCLAAVV